MNTEDERVKETWSLLCVRPPSPIAKSMSNGFFRDRRTSTNLSQIILFISLDFLKVNEVYAGQLPKL